MSLNIIDLTKGQLGSALVSQIASKFEESETGITKALSGLLPLAIGGLAKNADNQEILNAISEAASQNILGNLFEGSNSPWIATLLPIMFGNKVGMLSSDISTFSGTSNKTSKYLLNLVIGAALGSVEKYANDNNLDKIQISALLLEQKNSLSSLVPERLSFTSFSFDNWLNNTEVVTEEPKVTTTKKEDDKPIWRWLLPLILILVAAYFLWVQYKKTNNTSTPTAFKIEAQQQKQQI